MSESLETQIVDDEIYLAGQPAPAGRYKQIDTRREVYLGEAGALPASLDGRVACYERIKSNWSETQQKSPSFHATIAAVTRR